MEQINFVFFGKDSFDKKTVYDPYNLTSNKINEFFKGRTENYFIFKMKIGKILNYYIFSKLDNPIYFIGAFARIFSQNIDEI
jgi:hypothetical protein